MNSGHTVLAASLLPLTFTVDRINLQWWANHDCRRLRSWPLGQAG